MKLVDSSGWLEFFTGGPLAEAYGVHLADLSQVITPTIVLYEVYRKIKISGTGYSTSKLAGSSEHWIHQNFEVE